MGTIQTRKRKDGTESHLAQIRIKRKGVVVHSEFQSFSRKAAAKLWMTRREAALSEPGALDAILNKPDDPKLSQVIAKYNIDKLKVHGKTKTQVLRAIADSSLGEMPCSTIDSQSIISYLQSLQSQPQTKGNYLSHLQSVFSIARPMWGYPLDRQQIEDARAVCTRMGIISKSKERTRRPTLPELDRILTHFMGTRSGRADAIPMAVLTAFALFSTRRLEEITRIKWADLDEANSEVTVRDMKNPGEKIGNDVRVCLPPEALRLIQAQKSDKDGPIFPHSAESVSASFTRTCKTLGIEDLHMHDLRHEGASRLFEMGWSIPRVATVTGHRTWTSLKRYSHLRQTGDKFEGWPWLEKLAPCAVGTV